MKNWLPPPPTSFRSECLATSFAVGHGDDFLYPSSPPLLTASFVRGATFMLECLMILRWLVEAEFTFQIVEHCHQLCMLLPIAGRSMVSAVEMVESLGTVLRLSPAACR